jgi:NTE family protein
MLKEIFGNVSFIDLKIPFACNATDIDTGDEVIIKHGLVRKGVIASGSIPVILKPVKREGKYLIDGALANPVPVSVLRDMGADFIIAVNTIPSVQARHKGDSVDQQEMTSREPNILSVVMQITHIINYRGLKTSLAGADIIIEPQVTSVGWSDFHRASECILKGKLATQAVTPEIKDRLVSSGISAKR